MIFFQVSLCCLMRTSHCKLTLFVGLCNLQSSIFCLTRHFNVQYVLCVLLQNRVISFTYSMMCGCMQILSTMKSSATQPGALIYLSNLRYIYLFKLGLKTRLQLKKRLPALDLILNTWTSQTITIDQEEGEGGGREIERERVRKLERERECWNRYPV